MCVCVCVCVEGGGGGGGYGGGGRGKNISIYIYLSLHCHHQNDPCIKMGSDESHFNVSLIVRGKVKRRCPQATTFEENGKPKRIRTEVLFCFTARPNRLTPSTSFLAQF